MERTAPGGGLDPAKMPAHWLLARLGKRVLRPGGVELTNRMLEALNIQSSDAVVEFAPGLGATAKLTLSRHPVSYTAIEQDQVAANQVIKYLLGPQQRCLVASADNTELPEMSATVVYGEAMLTMQPPERKRRIVQEAFRLLKPGGRYGIHELGLIPDDLDDNIKGEIQKAVSQAIRVGARPLTRSEWRTLLEASGFEVQAQATGPMHLLEPKRVVQDEGIWRALTFACNVLRNAEARRRLLTMRRVFRKYHEHLVAIALVGLKREPVA